MRQSSRGAATLEHAVKDLVPSQVRVFLKLTIGKPTYHFYRWDRDKLTGSAILRYWFWNRDHSCKNRKGLFVGEVETLLESTLNGGEITRQDFERHCPRSSRDGGCGFAIIIGILEALEIVGHTDRRGVYAILDPDRAESLLTDR